MAHCTCEFDPIIGLQFVYTRNLSSLIPSALWQIVIGLATFYTLFAVFEVKMLHRLLFVAMFVHIVGYFATVIYLLVRVNPKNTAKYVFTDSTSLSGWESPGVSRVPRIFLLQSVCKITDTSLKISWLIGLLTSAIGFVSWDSPLHMSEEMKHASRDLPRSCESHLTAQQKHGDCPC